MPEFSIHVDDTAWQDALDLLLTLIPGVLQDAGHEGAEEIAREAQFSLAEHAHGFGTYSDAPVGGPPGEISGELGGSYVIEDTDDGAKVGPTAPYAREQELGGPMSGHPWMHWRNEGGIWYRKLVVLGPRPYHKPATERVISSGQLTVIYVDYMEKAILEVTG